MLVFLPREKEQIGGQMLFEKRYLETILKDESYYDDDFVTLESLFYKRQQMLRTDCFRERPMDVSICFFIFLLKKTEGFNNIFPILHAYKEEDEEGKKPKY